MPPISVKTDYKTRREVARQHYDRKLRTRRLQRLLSCLDAKSQAECEALLASLPADEANEMLVSVMDAPSFLTTIWILLGVFFLLFFPFFGLFLVFAPLIALGFPLLLFLGVGVGFALSLLTKGIAGADLLPRRKSPMTHAALYLAHRGDARALPLIVEDWFANLPGIFRSEDRTAETEMQLHCLLQTLVAHQESGRPCVLSHRNSLALKRLVSGALNTLCLRIEPDWSDRRTDIFLLALLLLERSPVVFYPALLRRIVQTPATGANRALLRDIAAELLESDIIQSTANRVAAARESRVRESANITPRPEIQSVIHPLGKSEFSRR